MPHIIFCNLRLPLIRLRARRSPHHGLSRQSSTLTASPQSFVRESRDIRQEKLNDLIHALTQSSTPSRVWAYYINLLNFIGYEKLPVEVHQQVLRQCTPPATLLRVVAARRIFVGNRPKNAHMHEGRFQSVIRNMRALGQLPSLDDYNFILEQFAAVGHHVGVMQVYKELIHLGLTPRTKTFGLCLQAIAHRLTLPVAKRHKLRLVLQTRKMMADLVNGMKELHIPFTSYNLDLTMRILKETTDREGFERLMRSAYGIDLSNPDCPPLHHRSSVASDLPPLPEPQPFSTMALNTTIDTLGRLGDISKMVQAFEVLTHPLPPTPHRPSSFDDEEDDDFGVPAEPSSQQFIPPSALPNTTTYNILLRYICRSGHGVFARHYLNEVMELDRTTDRILRTTIRKHIQNKQSLKDIPAPHFAINRGTLVSVFGASNRDNNVGLMRWLSTKTYSILKKKRVDLLFYTQIRDRQKRRGEWPYDEPPADSSPAPISPAILGQVEAVADTPAPEPSSLSRIPSILERIRMRWQAPKGVGAVFDVNLDQDVKPDRPLTKTLDLHLHIRILQRDISEIESFDHYLKDQVARTVQRAKERLGRRVWENKDVYLRTASVRQKISRAQWIEIAGFKPRRTDDVKQSHTPPNFIYSLRRRYSTTPNGIASRRPLSPPPPLPSGGDHTVQECLSFVLLRD